MHFHFSFPSYPEHEEWHVCELSQLRSRPHRCTVPHVLAEQQVFQQHLQQRESALEHTAVSCIHSKTILQHPSKEAYIFILRNWRGVWGGRDYLLLDVYNHTLSLIFGGWAPVMHSTWRENSVAISSGKQLYAIFGPMNWGDRNPWCGAGNYYRRQLCYQKVCGFICYRWRH